MDWSAIWWLLLGRLPGMIVGVLIVAAVPLRALQIIVAGSVLGAVSLTVLRVQIPRNKYTLMGAGVVAGITGTASGVVGPRWE